MSELPPIHLSPALEERLAGTGQQFLADFLGLCTQRNPGHLPALAELAQVLTQLGRIEEGLVADQKLAQLAPEDELVHYNLACSLCLLGRHDEALDALERSVELGYSDLDHLLRDEDLVALGEEPRFQKLIKRLGKA